MGSCDVQEPAPQKENGLNNADKDEKTGSQPYESFLEEKLLQIEFTRIRPENLWRFASFDFLDAWVSRLESLDVWVA